MFMLNKVLATMNQLKIDRYNMYKIAILHKLAENLMS